VEEEEEGRGNSSQNKKQRRGGKEAPDGECDVWKKPKSGRDLEKYECAQSGGQPARDSSKGGKNRKTRRNGVTWGKEGAVVGGVGWGGGGV